MLFPYLFEVMYSEKLMRYCFLLFSGHKLGLGSMAMSGDELDKLELAGDASAVIRQVCGIGDGNTNC